MGQSRTFGWLSSLAIGILAGCIFSNFATRQILPPTADLVASRWPLIVMKTKTHPSFILSLPTNEEDDLRFEITKTGVYYEKQLTEDVYTILSAPAHTDGRESVVVIDVGCNAGWFALYSAAIFRSYGARHKAYCFEANPNLQPRLMDSLRFNHGFNQLVELIPKAVTDKIGEAQLSWDSPHYGRGSLKAAGGKYNATVQTTTLDAHFFSLAAPLPKVLFLKIDVEGFECLVIRGAANFLKSFSVMNLFVEISYFREEETKCRVDDWLPQLVDRGYEIRVGHDISKAPIPRGELNTFIAERREKLGTGAPYRAMNVWLRIPDSGVTQ